MAFIQKGNEGEETITSNPQTTTNTSSTGEIKTPTFESIVGEYLSGGSLSQDANSYVKKLREILEDKTNLLQITTKKLNQAENSFLFSSKEFGIILIFNDMIMSDVYQIARNELISNAITAAKRMDTNIKILNAVIITKHDYAKVNAMASYITDVFRIYTSGIVSTFNINGFSGSESCMVDINIDNVRSYMDARDPSGIPARCDIGLICYKTMGGNQYNRNDNRNYANKKPLFAISAYTEFVPDSYVSGKAMFTPLIHITNICTPLVFPGIIPLALSIAAEVFGAYKLWQTPYRQIKKGTVNLGNLLIDRKTNKPKSVNNEKELMYMFAEHFTAPAIVLDVTEGKARIPSLSLFANTNMTNVLSDIFKKFLCITGDEPLKIIGKLPSQEIIGTSQITGLVSNAEIIDTRYIDYLNIVNLLGYDNRTNDLFAKYALDPMKKVELIKSITNDTSFTFLNNEILLNGSFLKYLVEQISSFVNIINPLNDNVISNIDIKSLLDNTYSAAPSLGRSGYNIPNANSTYRYGLL